MAGGGEAAAMAKAREHIEEMRRVRYSIGGDANQLSEDLHQAVKFLSAELYSKDVHFLMELIQVFFFFSFLSFIVFCSSSDFVSVVEQAIAVNLSLVVG